jgi:hypothetical protein
MMLTDGSKRLSFIVPPGWRIGASKTENKVVLQTRDYGATVDLRLPVNANSDASPGRLREQVLARATRAQIVKEYEWSTPFGRAIAFETEQAAAQNLKMLTRSIFVVRDAGVMEFNLTARPEKFGNYQKAFENLIASFRSE